MQNKKQLTLSYCPDSLPIFTGSRPVGFSKTANNCKNNVFK